MNSPRSIFVTGGTGFIGTALLNGLSAKSDNQVSALVRRGGRLPAGVSPVLPLANNFLAAEMTMSGVDVVIHLAARAHVLNDTSTDPLGEFRRVNVIGTLELAKQALAMGVKRFIFISSIGVNGSCTTGEAFDESSLPLPHADYALSKWEAEQGLRELVSGSAMELLIIRPPLVYAGHAPGNFQRLMGLVRAGLPLPFASVDNQRSMIALENLVDFIVLCVEHPKAANELFLISDGVDVSTPEIVRSLALGMGKRARLLPMSDALMRWGARAIGKHALYSQLCGSLVVDSSKARNFLGWVPALKPHDALQRAGELFVKRFS